MLLESLLHHYPVDNDYTGYNEYTEYIGYEDIDVTGDRPFVGPSVIQGSVMCELKYQDKLIEVYGNKIKRARISIEDEMLSEDVHNILHIMFPVEFLLEEVCRLELNVSGESLYWIENDVLKLMIDYCQHNGYEKVDILHPFMDYIPYSTLNGAQVDIVLNIKPEYVASSSCEKHEEEHKRFLYHNFDEQYHKDFGYDERAFEIFKIVTYFIKVPSIVLYGDRLPAVRAVFTIPVTQLYNVSYDSYPGRIVIKNTHLFGISTQILFETFEDDDKICRSKFRLIANKGIVDNIYLCKHGALPRLYYLDIPHRKCSISDGFLTFLYDGHIVFKNLFAVFSNTFRVYEHIGNVLYHLHQTTHR